MSPHLQVCSWNVWADNLRTGGGKSLCHTPWYPHKCQSQGEPRREDWAREDWMVSGIRNVLCLLSPVSDGPSLGSNILELEGPIQNLFNDPVWKMDFRNVLTRGLCQHCLWLRTSLISLCNTEGKKPPSALSCPLACCDIRMTRTPLSTEIPHRISLTVFSQSFDLT